jgi:hypothetical protein
MEEVNQYRVVKDYYLPNEEGSIEWCDHEIFNNFEDAWAKMKKLKNSGIVNCTDRWWIRKKGYAGIFQLPEVYWTRQLPWRVEWL